MKALLKRLLTVVTFFHIFNSTVNAQCGNNGDNGPGGCGSGGSGGANPINPYSGNVYREIMDLQVWGGVGEIPLEWMRYGAASGWTLMQCGSR